MNKRIQELAEQAGLQPYYDAQKEQIAKFAELIVRECMTTVLKESKWYWDKDEWESSNAIQNAARRLKEHFGVEK
jgi:hypothetical protein